MTLETDRPRSTRRAYIAAAGTAGLGSLAGCLGFLIAEDDAAIERVSELEVDVGPGREDDFDPRIGHVDEGGTVTFTWASGNHDVTSMHLANDVPEGAPDGSTPFSQDLNGPGQQLVWDFEEPGVYHVICVRHERVGMLMSIIVGEPEDLDDEPALGEPDPALSDATRDRWSNHASEIRELLGGSG